MTIDPNDAPPGYTAVEGSGCDLCALYDSHQETDRAACLKEDLGFQRYGCTVKRRKDGKECVFVKKSTLTAGPDPAPDAQQTPAVDLRNFDDYTLAKSLCMLMAEAGRRTMYLTPEEIGAAVKVYSRFEAIVAAEKLNQRVS
jgi:hypothetical protein